MMVNKVTLLLLILLIYQYGYAQEKNLRDTTKTIRLYHCSITYPRKAEENNIIGTVIVLFDIDSNCRYVNIRLEKGLGYGCDEAAVKALKSCKLEFKGTRRSCAPQFNLRQLVLFKNPEED